MRVLVACECSGRVREAFRRLGHEAFSCDLEPAEDGSPFHFQADALETAWQRGPWDLMIAHPPCTDLSVSGARYFDAKRADGRQARGLAFVMELTRVPIARWAIENPVSVISSHWREPDQVVQPWMFGHGETKATCLWLQGLPLLMPTHKVSGRHPRMHLLSPGPNRARERSRTYPGIAEAMAHQWGDYSDLVTQAETAAYA